jgi:hypothetical protein
MILPHGYRKGQYFSFDAIVATVIFVLTLVMLLSYWNSVRTYLDYQTNDLGQAASHISDMLFQPPTGDCTDGFITLGFASSWSDQRINESLVQCAEKLSSDQLKADLGSSYNVSIVITDEIDPSYDVKLGDDPTAPAFSDNKNEVDKITRVASLVTPDGHNDLATLDVYVYQ